MTRIIRGVLGSANSPLFWSSLLVGAITLTIVAGAWLVSPNGVVAAPREPQVTNLRFSPTDNGQVQINYRIEDVQDGADVLVYLHWLDSGSTFRQAINAICLERDADFEYLWTIPESLASANELELALQVTGTFWPDDDSGPSWIDSALGVQQVNAVAPAAVGVGVAFAGRIAWRNVTKKVTEWLVTTTIAVATVASLPPEWDGWDRNEKGRWGEGEARRMLKECGWEILASNETLYQNGRQVTEQDVRAKKPKFFARDPNALVGVRPSNNVSRGDITDLVAKADNFRVARGNANSYMLAVYPGGPHRRSIDKITNDLKSALKSTGFKRGFIMDMATGCPTEVWKQ